MTSARGPCHTVDDYRLKRRSGRPGSSAAAGRASLRPDAARFTIVLPLWLGHHQLTTLSPGARPEGPRDARGLLGRVAPEGPVAPAVQRAASPETTPTGPWGRQIIRQATLAVELGDVERAIAQLTELVEAAGGYVADTQAHADAAGVARATVTVYVPPAAFSRTLRDLEQLGRVTSRRISGHDVSEEFVDLEARVRNLERHEAQLVAFMGKAQKVVDLVSLEGEVARVRGEIERLTGRLRFLRASPDGRISTDQRPT